MSKFVGIKKTKCTTCLITLCLLQFSTNAKETRVILSIDGGGIRGLIPALVLEELERKVECPLTDVIDIFAGTSTGGIIALGLTVPGKEGKPKYQASDLVKLYKTKGGAIFPKDRWRQLFSLFLPAHSLKGMRAIFKEYFSNLNLSQTLKDVLITSYDLDHAQPYYFENTKARESYQDEFKLADVAEATARAQTYLDMGVIKNINGENYHLIDGGNVENNPTELAYQRARELYPEDDFLVISLGTGDVRKALHPEQFKRGKGLIGWAEPTISLQMSVHSFLVHDKMTKLLSSDSPMEPRYLRFDKRLQKDEVNPDLADVSPRNIERLRSVGEAIIEGYQWDLNYLADKLKSIKLQREAVVASLDQDS